MPKSRRSASVPLDLQRKKDPKKNAATEASSNVAMGEEMPAAAEVGAGAGESAARDSPMSERTRRNAIRDAVTDLQLRSAIAATGRGMS